MGYNWGRGGSGAMSGAAAGSAFGPWGAAAGGALGAFSGFGDDPEDAAKKYYDQIPGTMKKYYDPYVNAGRNAMGNLQGRYGQMMDNPDDIISRLGAGYQESPGYKFQLQQGQAAIGNANAAGGMAGTQQHMQQSGQLANNLANQDYQQYLQNAMGLYGRGLQGEEGINQMGFGASTDLGSSLAQSLANQGNLAYSQQNNSDQQMGAGLGNLYGAFGDKDRMKSNWWNTGK